MQAQEWPEPSAWPKSSAWRDRRGLAASALLHLAVLALWLTWSHSHPVTPPQPLKALLVDLVAQTPTVPGTPGGAPVVRPRPATAVAIKPVGEKPQSPTPLPDVLEARIAGLANLSAASSVPADGSSNGQGAGDGGGYTLADYVRAQILRRWWPRLESNAAAANGVALTLKLSRNGSLSDIRIVDQARFTTDLPFRNLALSARNAAMLASPIPLPPGHYAAITDIAITLDPKAVMH